MKAPRRSRGQGPASRRGRVTVGVWQSGGELVTYDSAWGGLDLVRLLPEILPGIEGAVVEVTAVLVRKGRPKTCWEPIRGSGFRRCLRRATEKGRWWRCSRHASPDAGPVRQMMART